jgi:hypothetical protein
MIEGLYRQEGRSLLRDSRVLADATMVTSKVAPPISTARDTFHDDEDAKAVLELPKFRRMEAKWRQHWFALSGLCRHRPDYTQPDTTDHR